MSRYGFSDIVDPRILPIVELLNDAGIKTFASCQGGGDSGAPRGADTNEHSQWQPWVKIVWEPADGYEVQGEIGKVVRTLRDRGIYGFTISYNKVYHSAKRVSLTPYVEVMFFSPAYLVENVVTEEKFSSEEKSISDTSDPQ